VIGVPAAMLASLSYDGQMGEEGLSEYLVLLSVQQTCKYRGVSFLKFLLSRDEGPVRPVEQTLTGEMGRLLIYFTEPDGGAPIFLMPFSTSAQSFAHSFNSSAGMVARKLPQRTESRSLSNWQ